MQSQKGWASSATQGKAILIGSHILTELAEICNGAVIIEQGKLLMAGAISELLSTDGLRRTVIIRALERPEDLVRDLLQMPHVESANPADRRGRRSPARYCSPRRRKGLLHR